MKKMVKLKHNIYGMLAKDPKQGIYKPAWTTSKDEVMLGWPQDQLKQYKVQPWYVTVDPEMIVRRPSHFAERQTIKRSAHNVRVSRT